MHGHSCDGPSASSTPATTRCTQPGHGEVYRSIHAASEQSSPVQSLLQRPSQRRPPPIAGYWFAGKVSRSVREFQRAEYGGAH